MDKKKSYSKLNAFSGIFNDEKGSLFLQQAVDIIDNRFNSVFHRWKDHYKIQDSFKYQDLDAQRVETFGKMLNTFHNNFSPKFIRKEAEDIQDNYAYFNYMLPNICLKFSTHLSDTRSGIGREDKKIIVQTPELGNFVINMYQKMSMRPELRNLSYFDCNAVNIFLKLLIVQNCIRSCLIQQVFIKDPDVIHGFDELKLDHEDRDMSSEQIVDESITEMSNLNKIDSILSDSISVCDRKAVRQVDDQFRHKKNPNSKLTRENLKSLESSRLSSNESKKVITVKN